MNLLVITFYCSMVVSSTLCKEEVATPDVAPAASEVNEVDSAKSEDASHNEAYNSIISNYYTTDPFFGINQDIKKEDSKQAPVHRPFIGERRISGDQSDPSVVKRKKVKILSRKMIPAPLLSRLDDDGVYSTTPPPPPTTTTLRVEQQSKIPAPLLVGGVSQQKEDEIGFQDIIVGTNQEVEERVRFKRMHRKPGQDEQPTQIPERGAFSQLFAKTENLKEKEETQIPKKDFFQGEIHEKETEKPKQETGFFDGEMEKFEFGEDDHFFKNIEEKKEQGFFGENTEQERNKEEKQKSFFGEDIQEKKNASPFLKRHNVEKQQRETPFFVKPAEEKKVGGPPPFFNRNNVDRLREQQFFGDNNQGKQNTGGFFEENDEERKRGQAFFEAVDKENVEKKKRGQGTSEEKNEEKIRPTGFYNPNVVDKKRGQPFFNENNEERKRGQGFFNENKDDERKRGQGFFNKNNEEGKRGQGFFNENNDDERRGQGFFNKNTSKRNTASQSFNRENKAPTLGAEFFDEETEKFNFNEGTETSFPGDERDDIPNLPTIESREKPERNIQSGFPDTSSQSYFDIMSDFFDESEIEALQSPKTVVPRSTYPIPASPPPPVVQQQQPYFNPPSQLQQVRQFSRQPVHTTTVGHTYREPLSYNNPLDVDHNPADVGYYDGPKYGSPGPYSTPPQPRPAPYQPSHQPRLLDDVPHDNGFLDIPKIGAPGNFFPTNPFGSEESSDFEASPAPRRPVNRGFDSGKVPLNFPHPDISSQLDDIPDHQPPSFVGITPFDEQIFDSQLSNQLDESQSRPELRPQFRDIDESELHEARPLRRPVASQALRYQEEAPMPHLSPPPEMLEMQRNSFFPVDVPKLGANVPYRPPELVFDEFHKRGNSQFTPDVFENSLQNLPNRNIAKKEAPAKNYYAPIRADVSPDFQDVNESFNKDDLRDTVQPSTFNKGRAAYRSLETITPTFASPTTSSFDDDETSNSYSRHPEAFTQRSVQRYESTTPYQSTTQTESNSFKPTHPSPPFPKQSESSTENYSPRPGHLSPPFAARQVQHPESFNVNQENEVENYSKYPPNRNEFLKREIENIRPIRDDISSGRPDPFEFHQKIASQFDGQNDDEDSGFQNQYQNDPIRVTNPPSFQGIRRDHGHEIETPEQSELYDSDPEPQYVQRALSVAVSQPNQYAIYDPLMFKSSANSQRFKNYDEDAYEEFESGKYSQPKSFKQSNSKSDEKSIDRRSFDYGRALQFPLEKVLVDHTVDDDDAHQYTQVGGRDRFRAGHKRGNPRHQVHNTQDHNGPKHREEVKFDALLAAASASLGGPLSTFDDWSQRIMTSNAIDTSH